MNKDFVTYEQAVQLKELGFNESCFACYINGYPKSLSIGSADKKDVSKFLLAPTYSSVFRWFREKHPYRFYIIPCSQHKKHLFEITLPSSIVYTSIEDYAYDTYEEAEQALLCKLIELVIS